MYYVKILKLYNILYKICKAYAKMIEHKNVSKPTTVPKKFSIYIVSAVWIVSEIYICLLSWSVLRYYWQSLLYWKSSAENEYVNWIYEKWERFQLTYIFSQNSFPNKWKVTCLKHNSVVLVFLKNYYYFCLIPWERSRTSTVTCCAVGKLLSGRRLCP